MPFPRVKGQIYEKISISRWRFAGAVIFRRAGIGDFINIRDVAPPIHAGVGRRARFMTGRSFLDVLQSGKSGTVDATRNVMLVGKERHDLGRPNDAGYPVRAIRTLEFLYVRNYEPAAGPRAIRRPGIATSMTDHQGVQRAAVFDE